MRDFALQEVLEFATTLFGEENVQPYGSDWNDPHDLGFKIGHLPLTCSFHTQEGSLPPDLVDCQFEGVPPGDYLVSSITSITSIRAFLSLIASTPGSEWPTEIP